MKCLRPSRDRVHHGHTLPVLRSSFQTKPKPLARARRRLAELSRPVPVRTVRRQGCAVTERMTHYAIGSYRDTIANFPLKNVPPSIALDA